MQLNASATNSCLQWLVCDTVVLLQNAYLPEKLVRFVVVVVFCFFSLSLKSVKR